MCTFEEATFKGIHLLLMCARYMYIGAVFAMYMCCRTHLKGAPGNNFMEYKQLQQYKNSKKNPQKWAITIWYLSHVLANI